MTNQISLDSNDNTISSNEFITGAWTEALIQKWISLLKTRFDNEVTSFKTEIKCCAKDYYDELTAGHASKETTLVKMREITKKYAAMRHADYANMVKVVSHSSKLSTENENLLTLSNRAIEMADVSEVTLHVDELLIQEKIADLTDIHKALFPEELAKLKLHLEEQKDMKRAKLDKLKAEYANSCAEWQHQCETINSERENLLQARFNQEESRIKKQALSQKDLRCNSLLTEKKGLEIKIKQEQDVLSTLPFFKLGEKKKVQTTIETLQARAAQIDLDIMKAEELCKGICNLAHHTALKKRGEFTCAIMDANPLPEKPAQPSEIAALETELGLAKPQNPNTSTPATNTRTRNEQFKISILEFMKDGRAYKISDIMNGCKAVSTCSNTLVSAIMRQLVESGQVTREEVKRIAYFSIIQ